MNKESILYIVAGLLLIFLAFLLMKPEAEVTENQVTPPDTTMPSSIVPADEAPVPVAREGSEVVISDSLPKAEALTSNSWLWQKTLMNDGAVITPKQQDAFTLTFTTDGRVNGTTDCNGFSGSYEVADGVITMGQFMMTMMYCEGSQEMEFQNMLVNPVPFMFTDAGELVLMLKYDSGSVILTPVI